MDITRSKDHRGRLVDQIDGASDDKLSRMLNELQRHNTELSKQIDSKKKQLQDLKNTFDDNLNLMKKIRMKLKTQQHRMDFSADIMKMSTPQ